MKIWSFKKYSQTHSSSLFRLHLEPTLPLIFVAAYVVTVRFPQQQFGKIQLCMERCQNLKWLGKLVAEITKNDLNTPPQKKSLISHVTFVSLVQSPYQGVYGTFP